MYNANKNMNRLSPEDKKWVESLIDQVLMRKLIKEPYSLHYACYNGDIKTVAKYINFGADINKQGVCDRTPLHYAIENGQCLAVKFLIEKGADLTKKDSWGKDALETAKYVHHPIHGKEILELLTNALTNKS